MKYFISSCSNGKDSLAMTYRLIEEKRPLDEIIFYDTGWSLVRYTITGTN